MSARFLRGLVTLGVVVGGGVAATQSEILHAKFSLFSKNDGTSSSTSTRPSKCYGKFAFDNSRSKLNVFVYKAGALSAFGHNLCLRANDWDSNVTISPNGDYTLQVSVNPSSLEVEGQVKIDDKGVETVGSIDSWSKGQIISTMRGSAILDVKKFPAITYKGVGKRDDTGLQIAGELVLKGVSKPLPIVGKLTFDQTQDGKPRVTLQGQVNVTQSKWGIKPLSQGFGALSLKDDVKVTWNVTYVMATD